MAPILVALWNYRRVLIWGAVVLTVAAFLWRVAAWKDSHERLPAVEAELASERACEATSKCAERAAALALAAAQEAAVKSAEAVSGALAREEAAQRDAAEWRRKYRSAVQDDPDCAAWAAGEVKCPL